MGASPTHTEDTALQTPVRFRSGQVVCYQSFARAQGGTREFASQVPTSTLPANITSYGRGAGVGHGSGAHASDEYYIIESTNPKIQGFDGVTMSFVEYLYELAK